MAIFWQPSHLRCNGRNHDWRRSVSNPESDGMVTRPHPAQGVRSLAVSCWLCHHGAVLAVDRWPDATPVASFGPRMVCTGCGIVGADVRPNWTERPERESLTGGAVAM
jgi:hypothetical protein